MGKLTYLMNVSLDGFVETTDHSVDWGISDEALHTWFAERTGACAASIYGRRMYEVMTGYWPTGAENPASTPAMREFARAWSAMPKVVFSRSLESADFGFRLANGDIGEVLDGLRGEVDGEIQVSGPNMAGQFIERGLVDEFPLVVHPVFLGAGTPYFPRDGRRLDLRQTGVERFASGVVALTYERA